MRPIIIRLTRNKDLRKGIEEYCQYHGISAAAVVGCAGCVLKTRIRLADGKTVKDFPGEREIVSLSGTVSEDGSHIHISLADGQGSVIGGHLSYETVINTTAEIIMLDLTDDYRLTREYDPQTGYAELVIREK